MSKTRLFLTTTDISQMTGLTMRTARKIVQFVRDERRLGKRQVISIFDFCASFSLPVNVVYVYVNTDLFKKGPIDEDSMRAEYQKKVLESGMKYLYHEDFDIFMTQKELNSISDLDEDVEREEGIA